MIGAVRLIRSKSNKLFLHIQLTRTSFTVFGTSSSVILSYSALVHNNQIPYHLVPDFHDQNLFSRFSRFFKCQDVVARTKKYWYGVPSCGQ